MDTKTRENSIVTTSISDDLQEVTANVKGAGSVTIHMWKLRTDVREYAACHGIKQKIGDAAAQSRDPLTGKSASPAQKLAAIQKVVDRLENGGNWNGVSGGSGSADITMLIKALTELYPNIDVAVLTAKVTGMTAEQRAAALVDERVAEIVRRLTAERVRHVDTDQLFMDLDTLA